MLKGQRVQICYDACHGNHLRKDCTNGKVSWLEYVNQFKLDYPEIQEKFYCNWTEKARKNLRKCPTEKDFNLPTKL